ncbi:DUF3883 domain-containing protein [Roseibium sp.]|uniref:DUF3883 domain-containing protein n=1 Tax=Roseibium sp. TaxID=1936156 RepID=UPI003A97AE4F
MISIKLPNHMPPTTSLAYEADLCGNIEQALKALQGYGVMALELIQNADDAHAKTLSFDVRSDALFVNNDANFTKCDLTERKCPWESKGDPDGQKRSCNFHAISKMGGRSKIGVTEQIGRFGIGFVSVYQITDTPIVRSSGWQMRLNPYTGHADLQSIEEKPGTVFELPWASSRSAVRNALNASPTPTDVAEKFVAEVERVLRSSLLFLRHLERVEVLKNGIRLLSVKIERIPDGVELVFQPDGRTEKWMLLTRDAQDLITERKLEANYEILQTLDRSTQVNIAIPVDTEPSDGLLYAYLPTRHHTNMPFHINGDFFPHASRQEIVLSGEGHERYWNETLLEAAAAIIADNFLLIRDTLGPERLWRLAEATFKLRSEGPFRDFWNTFSSAAEANESIWIVGEKWSAPKAVRMAPEQLDQFELSAFSTIGLRVLHPCLRPHHNCLSTLGVSRLRLSMIADAIEEKGDEVMNADDPNIAPLWTAIAAVIDQSRDHSSFISDTKKLKSSIFLLDVEGNACSPNELWRMPAAISPDLVRQYIADCPIVHTDVLRHQALAELIDLYELDSFAAELAAKISDPIEAEAVIDRASHGVRGIYELLVAFPFDETDTEIATILADTPFLKTSKGYVSPSRGQLPGGFNDPIGHFEFVDSSHFPMGMTNFARDVLKVNLLSFREYIEDHLEEILATEPSVEDYRALLAEIIDHRNELLVDGNVEFIARKRFVRTRAGTYVRPEECYYWAAILEKLLGNHAERWVDETWMLAGSSGGRLRDFLEGALGMPTTVSMRHIVDHIEEIADEGTPYEVAEALNPIIRHLLDGWNRYGEDDLEILEELQHLHFLPAQVSGTRDADNLYPPYEIYRATRAAGFLSQVPVVDITPLRQASAVVNTFLDHLDMPSEPPTEVVVEHLIHCIETNTPPSDVVYAILSERIEKEDGVDDIGKLRGTSFIYDGVLKVFLPADRIFWRTPPFGQYWYAASERMRLREPLYRHLGVVDVPTPSNYAMLLKEIAAKPLLDENDPKIHSQCLEAIALAFDNNESKAFEAIEELEDYECLLNVELEPLFPNEAIWIDSEQLAAPFGDELNGRLIRAPLTDRTIAARFFRKIGTDAISDIAHMRLAAKPDNTPAHEETERLKSRRDLLLWLAPNPNSRTELTRILDKIEIRLTRSLHVQVEITESDPTVRSPSSQVPAFYDPEDAVLHLRGESVSSNEWTAAFRAIFSEIEKFCPSSDLKPIAPTASFVIMLPSYTEAEEMLLSADYQPPEEDAYHIPFGDVLDDIPAESEDATASPGGDHTDEDELDTYGSVQQHDRGDAAASAKPRDELDLENGDNASPGTASGTPTASRGDLNPSGAYQSKASGTPIASGAGNPDKERTAAGNGSGSSSAGKSWAGAGKGEKEAGRSRTGREVRRSRMLAYVAREGMRGEDDAQAGRIAEDISYQIDDAAISAVLKYEQSHGRTPEEQPHGNPGYDIISMSPNGQRRLIEVKGLESTWTERGIKLSHVQYQMAEDYPDEYWIYIVESARDHEKQRVSALNNPFGKVQEYWFDHNWREIREETAIGQDYNVLPGTKVRHQIWGVGTILETEKKGLQRYVKVDFGFEGRKYVPFNASLKIVDG